MSLKGDWAAYDRWVARYNGAVKFKSRPPLPRREHIKAFRRRHGAKYDYSLVPKNITSRSIVKIICPVHGIFEQSVASHKQWGCRFCGWGVKSRLRCDGWTEIK